MPEPSLAPYRCAAWDSDQQVVVVFGGEGSHEGTLIYDPWRNEWRWPEPALEPEPRSGGNMAYDAARKLHVLFGSQFTDDPHTWTYDVAANEWRDMQPETMPPTNENDAVLTYDPVHKVVLALVKITTSEDDDARHEVQTWAYDAGTNQWTRLRPATEPDAGGNRTRNLVFAPELNLAILENCISQPREQQVWTYRFADSPSRTRAADVNLPSTASQAAPPLVEDVVVSVAAANRVEVAWTPPAGAMPAGYHVERAVVEVWSENQLVRLKTKTPTLRKPSVGALRRIGKFQQLTPEPVAGTSSIHNNIDLTAPQSVAGAPLQDRELHDDHVDRGGAPYGLAVFAYRVRAVDGAGEVSGPSPAVFTIPSSPQQLFSREEGDACQLKWSANPETAIAGYRIYRLDGRWDADPVSRLTADPIRETSYTDEGAGEDSRRYYVVAVDALGQEGFPSSPVWHRREWGAFYEPFVGDWHQ